MSNNTPTTSSPNTTDLASRPPIHRDMPEDKRNPPSVPLPDKNPSREQCMDVFDDIEALLKGGRVPVGRYKEELKVQKDGKITKSITERINDLKVDYKNLYNSKPTGKDSYSGHQNVLKEQQDALSKALNYFDKNCDGRILTAAQKQTLKDAKKAADLPIPEKPDRENSSSSTREQLRRSIDSIPLIPQSQKDNFIKTLENSGIPKIIENIVKEGKKSANGVREYWEKDGRELLTKAIEGLGIAAAIAAAIAREIGKAILGDGLSRADSTTEQTNPTTVATASNNGNTASNTLESANKSAGETILAGTVTFDRQTPSQTTRSDTATGTDTAFIGSVNSNRDTALRVSLDTALRSIDSQVQQQTQQPELTPS